MSDPRWIIDDEGWLTFDHNKVTIASWNLDPDHDAHGNIRPDAFDALVAAVRDADTLRQAPLADLQARLVEWHEKRFPDADPTKVALKLNEEAGEVASAVLALLGRDSATGKGDVAEECGDVLIAVLVLLGRWFPHINVVASATAKLDLLSSPVSPDAPTPTGQTSCKGNQTMTTSNTNECFTDLIGHEVVGVLFDALPVHRGDLARSTKTLVLDDGTGLTISSNGSFWRESEEEVRRAVVSEAKRLQDVKARIKGVLQVAGARYEVLSSDTPTPTGQP